MDIPEWLLLPLIKHAGKQSKSRGDGSFTNAEEESGCHQATKVLACGMAHQDTSPEESSMRQDHLFCVWDMVENIHGKSQVFSQRQSNNHV